MNGIYSSLIKIMLTVVSLLQLPKYNRKEVISFFTYVSKNLNVLQLESVKVSWEDYQITALEGEAKKLLWSTLKLCGAINEVRVEKGKPKIRWIDEVNALEDQENNNAGRA